MKRLCLVSFAVLTAGVLFLTVSIASAQVDAFLGTPAPDSTRTDSFQAGYGFYATSGTQQVDQLGLWVQSGQTQVSHDVAIYNFNGSNYSLVAQATIPAGSTADGNGYAWVRIPTLTLTDTRPGADYYIVMANSGTDVWGPNTGNSNVPTLDPSFGTLTGNGWFASAGAFAQTESFHFPPAFGNGGYIGGNIGYLTPASTPIYWKGSTDGTWNSNVNNWTSDAAGTATAANFPNSSNDVYFTANGAANLDTTLGADFSLNSLNFTTTSPVTIGGTNTLTLGAGGLTVANGSGAHSINCAATLGCNQTWSNSSSNALTVNGGLGGVGPLSFAGTFILNGSNTYTCGTTVSGGTLQLNTNGAGGAGGALAAGSITVNSGATLLGNAFNALGYAGGHPSDTLTINKGGTLLAGTGVVLSMPYNLNVVGGTVASLDAGNPSFGSYYLDGSAPYNFTSSADGTPAVISAQRFNLAGTGTQTLRVARGGGPVDLKVTGSIVGGGLVKSGDGVMVLSGTNRYTGGTTISGGTLRLSSVAALFSPIAVTAQSFYAGDERSPIHAIDGSGMTPNNPVTPGSVCGNSPGHTMWLSNGTQQTWITFDLGSVQTLSGFHLWNYNENSNNPAYYTQRGVQTAGIYVGNSLLADGSDYTTQAGSNWGKLAQSFTFSQADGSNSYTGNNYSFTTPAIGRYIQIYVTGNFGGADAYTGISEIGFYENGSLPSSTPVSIASGAALDVNDANQTVASLSSSASDSHVYLGKAVFIVGDSSTTTFAGMISDSGGASSNTGGSLIKVGTGTLVLSGSNSYTGGTTVMDGSLILASSDSIADGTTLTVGADAGAIFGASAAGTELALHAGPAVTAVPEPGTTSLLLAGLWSAAVCCRFRRRNDGDASTLAPHGPSTYPPGSPLPIQRNG